MKKLLVFWIIIVFFSSFVNATMISKWSFDTGCNNTFALDDQGNYNGTVTNAVWNSTGGYDGNGAYWFDGDGDYIELEDIVELNNVSEFSLLMRLNWTDPTGNLVPFEKSKDFNERTRFLIASDLDVYAYINNEEAGYAANKSSGLQNNTWYHMAWVYNGSQATNETRFKLYVDGVERGLEFGNGPIPTRTANMPGNRSTIGMSNTFGSNYFEGFIDDVRFYDTALNSSQVLDVYNGSGSSTCVYSSGDWSVNASDSCSWSSNVDLSGNDWSISGSGTVTSSNVNFSNVNKFTIEGAVFTMLGGSVTVE